MGCVPEPGHPAVQQRLVAAEVHGEDILCPDRLLEAVDSGRGVGLGLAAVQHQEGQVQGLAPQPVQHRLEPPGHLRPLGLGVPLPVPEVQVSGVEDGRSLGTDQEGYALVGGIEGLHRYAVHSRPVAGGHGVKFLPGHAAGEEVPPGPAGRQFPQPGRIVVPVAVGDEDIERLRRVHGGKLAPPIVEEQTAFPQLHEKAAVKNGINAQHGVPPSVWSPLIISVAK